MTTQDASRQQTDEGVGGNAQQRVVVAYDASPASVTALTWAATEAGSRGARLRVLFAADLGSGVTGGPDALERAGREVGGRLTREGAERAAEVDGGPAETAIDTDVRLGDPTAAIVEASRGADLLVVGNRGRGAVAGALLGSVAFSVTARAECPVVVVREDTGMRPGSVHPVVVGTDNSEGASAAVEWAADEAVLAGAPLVLLAAWSPPNLLARGYSATQVAALAEVSEKTARDGAQSALARARQTRPDLQAEVRLVRDKPAKALAAASQDAGLVVVGARGLGSVGGLFLGSVSHATIHRSACPVAVVRTSAQT